MEPLLKNGSVQPLTVHHAPASVWRERLQAAQIRLNAHAEALLTDPRFTPTTGTTRVRLLIVTVADLGLTTGATLPVIFTRAQALGLHLCPLPVAVALRLHWRTQDASTDAAMHRHRAPQGAVTVASPVWETAPHHPKGFYLRRLDGQLWLRGYRCDDQFGWTATDQFAFML